MTNAALEALLVPVPPVLEEPPAVAALAPDEPPAALAEPVEPAEPVNALELVAEVVEPVTFCPTVTLTADTTPSMGEVRVGEFNAVCAVSTAVCAVVMVVWSTATCCCAVVTLAWAAVVSSPASCAVANASCAVVSAIWSLISVAWALASARLAVASVCCMVSVSTVASGWPAVTCCPADTSTAVTVPLAMNETSCCTAGVSVPEVAIVFLMVSVAAATVRVTVVGVAATAAVSRPRNHQAPPAIASPPTIPIKPAATVFRPGRCFLIPI